MGTLLGWDVEKPSFESGKELIYHASTNFKNVNFCEINDKGQKLDNFFVLRSAMGL